MLANSFPLKDPCILLVIALWFLPQPQGPSELMEERRNSEFFGTEALGRDQSDRETITVLPAEHSTWEKLGFRFMFIGIFSSYMYKEWVQIT